MKLSYLIDTDWVINHLLGREETIKKLQELKPAGLALSVISLAELYEGVYYAKNPASSEKGLKNFLKDVKILGVNQAVCPA